MKTSINFVHSYSSSNHSGCSYALKCNGNLLNILTIAYGARKFIAAVKPSLIGHEQVSVHHEHLL